MCGGVKHEKEDGGENHSSKVTRSPRAGVFQKSHHSSGKGIYRVQNRRVLSLYCEEIWFWLL